MTPINLPFDPGAVALLVLGAWVSQRSKESDMKELGFLLLAIAALGALAFGAVIFYRLAVGWDDQAPGDPDEAPGDPE